MMKFTGTRNVTPPDGFRYTFPDGTTIQQIAYNDWLLKIKEHYERNGYRRPDNWVQIAEDQLCKLLPPGHCTYEDGNNVMQHIDTRLTAGQIYRGAVALTHLVVNGEDDLVPIEEAERRGRICSACCANVVVAGCIPCMGILNLVLTVIGPKRTTASDPYLKSCACCKCPNTAHIHVKAEVLAKGVDEEQLKLYDLIPDCWKGKAIREYQAQQTIAVAD